MMLLLLLLPLFTFAGESELEAECQKGVGLSCAKLAYQLRKKGDVARAFELYDQGCKIGDATSCQNRTSLNPRDLYFDKLHGTMKFHHQKIVDCKPVGNRTIYSKDQLKEKWHKVFVRTHINSKGIPDLVKVTSELGPAFIACAEKAVKGITFPPPPGIDPTFDYDLTIQAFE